MGIAVPVSSISAPIKLKNKLHIKTLFHPLDYSTIMCNGTAQGRAVCQYLQNF